MEYIIENIRKTRIIADVDICVAGGGCTGVFAAVRAARLGANVAIIEKQNCFGGVATCGLVNIWHSLYDTDRKNQIISGLTYEVIGRLNLRHSLQEVENSATAAYRFDPNALKHELDRLVTENKIKVFFHSYYSDVIYDGNRLMSVIINNKDGRGAITAGFFIDATGDGDIMRDLGIEKYTHSSMQPPSACFLTSGRITGSLGRLTAEHGSEFGLDDDWGWSGTVPFIKDIGFRADYHIFNADCSKADELTFAEIEGRRKAYSFIEMVRKYDNPDTGIVALCSQIGIRETTHYVTLFKANERDLLTGKSYSNAILNGTYRIDVHHSSDNGITFKYLDGRMETAYGKDAKASGNVVYSRWDEEYGFMGEHAKFYQVPFDILVQEKFKNIIAAGRMINADEGAFGALRVMVNLNQLGEAAGVAAYECISSGMGVQDISSSQVVKELIKGGSALVLE